MLPHSKSVGHRNVLLTRSCHLEPHNSVRRYNDWSGKHNTGPFVHGHPEGDFFPNRHFYDGKRKVIYPNDSLYSLLTLKADITVSGRLKKVVRISHFSRSLKIVGRDADGMPLYPAVLVPKGLYLTNKREYRQRTQNADATFLLWLAKRLPVGVMKKLLPPSNHKTWSDRTWQLYFELQNMSGDWEDPRLTEL